MRKNSSIPKCAIPYFKLLQLWTTIKNTLHAFPKFLQLCATMEVRYTKYWTKCPLYAMSFVVDSKIKLAGVETIITAIGEYMKIDVSSYMTKIRNILYQVYAGYEQKFGNTTAPEMPKSTTPEGLSWKLFNNKKKSHQQLFKHRVVQPNILN